MRTCEMNAVGRCWADPMDEVVRPVRSLIAADAFLLQALKLRERERFGRLRYSGFGR
jgi:hypothetical protein